MSAPETPLIQLTYVLPIRSQDGPDPDLTRYLHWLGEQVDDIVIVDGSAPEIFGRQRCAWGGLGRHVPVSPGRRTAMGKIGGVLTGLDLARHERMVLADDDVRYERDGLEAVAARLATADIVVPQNYFDPLPWHAVYETGRVLVHRALDGDYPGTLGVRRSTLRRCDGYAGDVLFENLELIRTVRAHGGQVIWDRGLLVARRPPTARHFLGQRVRQAYDELARPAHLAVSLAVLPGLALALAGRRRPALLAGAAAVVAVAEAGRRRGGGAERFPLAASLLAPAWVLERGVCIWIALYWRLRGGVPYAGSRLKRAATPERRLRAAAG
ncbi:MAG: glycosyltransferase family 2 protein [Actinomycetota bacterium]|nr:glycosyltransferase family 2 protein [Actinomycetota bacterium]